MVADINPHPHDAESEAHDKYAFFWELQNRRGVPCFARDAHSWGDLSGDLVAQVQSRTKLDHAIYVRAYDFGKYPEIYGAMAAAGARLIPLSEAENFIRAGQTIAGVPGENG